MTLSVFLLTALGMFLLFQLPLMVVNEAKIKPAEDIFLSALSSIFLICAVLTFRSPQFGTDTVTYIGLFDQFCSSGIDASWSTSYIASFTLLNLGMLGQCDASLLPASWVMLVLIPLLLLPFPLPAKLAFIAIFLYSLPGIELTTNALRQGLAVSWSVLAVALRHKKPVAAVGLGFVATVFHVSAALALFIFLISNLKWKVFTVSWVILLISVWVSIMVFPEFSLKNPLLYEIEKYSQHGGDELGIRLLAALTVLVIPIGQRMRVLTKRSCNRQAERKGVIVRLCIALFPFLFLPYFGFRIIYGVYPIMLLLLFEFAISCRDSIKKVYVYMYLVNILILVLWAYGSSLMRDIPII